MPERSQDRRTGRSLSEWRREEIIVAPKEFMRSVEFRTERSLLFGWRIIFTIAIAILTLSISVLSTFFQDASLRHPAFQVIPPLVSAALSVWAGVLAFRSRRAAAKAEEIIAGWNANSSIAAEAGHEAQSAVLLRALEVFGESDRALNWMRESNPALSGDTPLHAIQDEQGQREVLNILGRIEYGVIS